MPKYAEDPIIEAILGVLVVPTAPIEISALEKACQETFSEYPALKPIKNPTSDGASTSYDMRISDERGFACGTKSGRSVHIRQNEFSFHCERPYGSWDLFYPEAYRCWLKYRDMIGVSSITGVYVRYINRINLPPTTVAMQQYFTAAPLNAEIKGAKISRRFSQFLALYKKDDVHAIVTQLTLKKTSTQLPYILDIDVHNHVDWEGTKDLNPLFLSFRKIKNEVFEQMITDKCRKHLKVIKNVRNRRSVQKA